MAGNSFIIQVDIPELGVNAPLNDVLADLLANQNPDAPQGYVTHAELTQALDNQGAYVTEAELAEALAGLGSGGGGGGAPVDHTHPDAVADGASGFMSGADKAKLDDIDPDATGYEHPTGDGSMHVPATSTFNDKKVLKAGPTPATFSWQFVQWGELQGVPNSFTPSSHSHNTGQISGLDAALLAQATAITALQAALGPVKFSVLSPAQYAAIGTKDLNTVYLLT